MGYIWQPDDPQPYEDDPMAELVKIITRDWGGDTIAFYKHVRENTSLIGPATTKAATNLIEAQATRISLLEASRARLIKILETDLKFFKRLGYHREVERITKATAAAKEFDAL